MSDKAEYELSKYIELEKLDIRGDVTLVKENCSGEIWVKKHISRESSEIYKKLIGNKCRNIVGVSKLIELDGDFYVIEEYIKGHSLKNLLMEKGTFSVDDVRSIVMQLCDGLAFLHSNDIIHRDIKPANIMIDNDGIVKLIDMDISRIHKRKQTLDTTILGTAGFAAPEQFGFMQTDTSADIYSVGVLMNVMLAGDIPSVKPYKKGKLSHIIENCIKIDPADRYSSATELKKALVKSNGLFSGLGPVATKILPGFRSGNIIKKIVAILIYVYMAISICDAPMYFVQGNIGDGLWLFFYGGVVVPICFFAAADFLEYQERLPFIKALPKGIRRALGIILAVAIFSFIVALFTCGVM